MPKPRSKAHLSRVRRLASRTGIPQFKFKKVLGLPLDLSDAKQRFWDVSLQDFQARESAFMTWVKLCTNAQQFTEAYEELPRAGSRLVGSKAERFLLSKWSTFTLAEVRKAKTLEEARRACMGASDRTAAWLVAFRKWVALCTTIEEAKAAYEHTSKVERSLEVKAEEVALRRMYQLSEKKR